MTRVKRVPGERPLFWVGSSRRDLLSFPDRVTDQIGMALSVAQFGGKHPSAKPWKGVGGGVFEIVGDHLGDTYRALYAIRFEGTVYVLHAFQKKSPSGIRTSKKDVELIAGRLKAANEDYKARRAKAKE